MGPWHTGLYSEVDAKLPTEILLYFLNFICNISVSINNISPLCLIDSLPPLLLIVGGPLIDDLADEGIQTLQLLVLGGYGGLGGLCGKEAHEMWQQAVYWANHLVIGAVHTGRNATLEGFETRQNQMLPLKVKIEYYEYNCEGTISWGLHTGY